MARSLKKGPFCDEHLMKKVVELNESNSKYILTQIFDYIDENKYLNIIRYNKAIKKNNISYH